MTAAREEEALLLLTDPTFGLPSECFPDAKGPLEEHNDAQIVAQVVGGLARKARKLIRNTARPSVGSAGGHPAHAMD